MIENFLIEYANLVAQYPEKIKVEVDKVNDNFSEVKIKAHKDDVGKFIGKDGKISNAIKTILLGYKKKNSSSYKIQIEALKDE